MGRERPLTFALAGKFLRLDALRDTALQSRLTQLATSNATTQGKPITPIVKPTVPPLVSHKPMIGLRNHCYICGRGNHLAKDCREPHKLDDNAALVEFVEVNALADQFCQIQIGLRLSKEQRSVLGGVRSVRMHTLTNALLGDKLSHGPPVNLGAVVSGWK